MISAHRAGEKMGCRAGGSQTYSVGRNSRKWEYWRGIGQVKMVCEVDG